MSTPLDSSKRPGGKSNPLLNSRPLRRPPQPGFCRALPGLVACLLTVPVLALEVSGLTEPQHVFAAGVRTIELRCRHDGAEPARCTVRLQLIQLTSATAAPVGGPRPWKTLTLLPGQTVIETALVEFPELRVSTRFAVRWLDDTGKLLGLTQVWAHPDNLLDKLKLLADGQPVGLADEGGALRAALAARGISVSELPQDESWSAFRGKLVFMVSPPGTNPDELRLGVRALSRAKEGLMVIWFLNSSANSPSSPTLVERVPVGRGVVVLVSAPAPAAMDHSPLAQLTLVRLAELAFSRPPRLLASHP